MIITNLHLAEKIFDTVVEYAATKNPKRHYRAIIGDIEKMIEKQTEMEYKNGYDNGFYDGKDDALVD